MMARPSPFAAPPPGSAPGTRPRRKPAPVLPSPVLPSPVLLPRVLPHRQTLPTCPGMNR